MKKKFRFFLLALALFLLCASLTACNPIPELRASHATWNEDSTISFGGKTYRPLPFSESLHPLFATNKTIEVTEADVPVLLSTFLGESAYIDDEGVFLLLDDQYYCVSEQYDHVVALIETGDPMLHYCHEESYYDRETYEYGTKRILLSDAVTAAFKSTLSKEAVNMMPGTRLEFDERVSIYRCSENLLFRSEASVFQIIYIWDPENYYLVVENAETQATDYYLIDEAHHSVIKTIFLSEIGEN